MLTGKEKSILAVLEPVAAQHGVEIVTVEVEGSRKAPTICVYIDTPEGVSFDELASAQEWVNKLMDELDPFPGAYMLNISSPGIDRPLRTPEHFERFAGEDVVITCRAPINGRGKFTGVLAGFADGAATVTLEDGTEVVIPLEDMKKAQVKGKVSFK